MRVLVGVSGGIAAYKAVTIVRGLVKAGHDVRVIPTRSALRMVGAPTWQALTGYPVDCEVFAASTQVGHVTLARDVDLFVIVPATADLLARLRCGRGDDMLTATALNVVAPVHVYPAMHSNMWCHPATRENVEVLRKRGVVVHDPVSGQLSSGDQGIGRLAEPAAILDELNAILTPGPLAGRRVVVSAGGTREPIDPVRFIGNRSSGRMGCALARAAARAGARVTLVAANIEPGLAPAGVEVVQAPTAADMQRTMLQTQGDADLIVMAAAVADYRPCRVQEGKIKKRERGAEGLTLHLETTPDVLVELVRRRVPGQMIVGFAAETGSPEQVRAAAKAKLRHKRCDYLVANRVGVQTGFGDVTTTVEVWGSEGNLVASFTGSKDRVAEQLIEFLVG